MRRRVRHVGEALGDLVPGGAERGRRKAMQRQTARDRRHRRAEDLRGALPGRDPNRPPRKSVRRRVRSGLDSVSDAFPTRQGRPRRSRTRALKKRVAGLSEALEHAPSARRSRRRPISKKLRNLSEAIDRPPKRRSRRFKKLRMLAEDARAISPGRDGSDKRKTNVLKRQTRKVRRSFRRMPAIVQVFALGLTAVLVGSGLYGIGTNLFQSSEPTVGGFFGKLSENSGTRTRLLLVGGTTAWSMSDTIGGSYMTRTVNGASFGLIGCGLLSEPAVVFGKTVQRPSLCLDWDRSFASANETFEPKVEVLMVGREDALPRRIGNETLPVSSPAVRARLFARIDAVRALAEANDARFVLATAPCISLPNGNENPMVIVLNRVVADYINSHPKTIPFDAHGVLCSIGKSRATKDGRPYVTPAGGITAFGAPVLWEAIAERVDQIVPPKRSARTTTTGGGRSAP